MTEILEKLDWRVWETQEEEVGTLKTDPARTRSYLMKTPSYRESSVNIV